jgi:hypothetical protein
MKYLIILDRENQLCNRLFLTSHMIGFACETNRTLINLGFTEYASLFPATAGDLLCRYPVPGNRTGKSRVRFRNVAAWMIKGAYLLTTRLLPHRMIRSSICTIQSGYESTEGKTPAEQMQLQANLDSEELMVKTALAKFVIVRGPLVCAPESFRKHEPAIRAYFTPHAACLSTVNRLVDSLRGENRVLVGVHIRQGDYSTFLDGTYYYGIFQYRALMNRVKDLFLPKEPVFIVCSDEPMQPGYFHYEKTVIGPGTVAGDLYTLAACDYLMGPPSTFTNWASFYGNVPLYVIRDMAKTPALEDFAIFSR